jgi:hypothetical protein
LFEDRLILVIWHFKTSTALSSKVRSYFK